MTQHNEYPNMEDHKDKDGKEFDDDVEKWDDIYSRNDDDDDD